MPYRGNHSRMKVFAQDAEEMSCSGKASGHLVNLSTTVNKYFVPSDSWRGPTRSTWMDPKRLVAGGMTVTGALVWRPTLEAWQGTQDLHQARTVCRIPGQTNRAAIKRIVGLVPPWESPCRALKIGRRKFTGTSGRIRPPPVSHQSLYPLYATCRRLRLEEPRSSAGSCSAENFTKSTEGTSGKTTEQTSGEAALLTSGEVEELTSGIDGRDRASATTFRSPLMCLISEENSDI